jgi:hypothetical protein
MLRRIVGAGVVQNKLDRYLPAEKTQKQTQKEEAEARGVRNLDPQI